MFLLFFFPPKKIGFMGNSSSQRKQVSCDVEIPVTIQFLILFLLWSAEEVKMCSLDIEIELQQSSFNKYLSTFECAESDSLPLETPAVPQLLHPQILCIDSPFYTRISKQSTKVLTYILWVGMLLVLLFLEMLATLADSASDDSANLYFACKGRPQAQFSGKGSRSGLLLTMCGTSTSQELQVH